MRQMVQQVTIAPVPDRHHQLMHPEKVSELILPRQRVIAETASPKAWAPYTVVTLRVTTEETPACPPTWVYLRSQTSILPTSMTTCPSPPSLSYQNLHDCLHLGWERGGLQPRRRPYTTQRCALLQTCWRGESFSVLTATLCRRALWIRSLTRTQWVEVTVSHK